MKYYICPKCASLTTEEQVLVDAGNGGQGMCMCQFIIHEWDEKYQALEPIHLREYIPYIEISKYWFDYFLGEENEILRLRLFNAIPTEKLLIDFEEVGGLIKAKLQRDEKNKKV
jgi:hypothetical protein